MLDWQLYRNLEISLKEFLDGKVTDDSVTDKNGTAIPVRVGRKQKNDWSLPTIAVYVDSEDLTQKLEIGSNKRFEEPLMIIDIFATDEGERMDLAKWVADTINDGFTYYAYSPNPSSPDSPTKVAGNLVNVDFVTNTRVNLGLNVDIEDAHRHRISVRTYTVK